MEKMTYNQRVDQLTRRLTCYAPITEESKAMGKIAAKMMTEAAIEFLGCLSEYGVNKRLAEYGLIPESKNREQ